MEVFASDVGKTGGKGARSSIPFRLQPSLNLVHAVTGYSLFRTFGKGIQLFGVEAIATAEGIEQLGEVISRSVSLGKSREHLPQANSKECIGLELRLVTEQMQFHKQLIGSASVERRNHVGKRCVKCPFAVCDRPKPCQGSLQLIQGMTIALPTPPLGLMECARAA